MRRSMLLAAGAASVLAVSSAARAQTQSGSTTSTSGAADVSGEAKNQVTTGQRAPDTAVDAQQVGADGAVAGGEDNTVTVTGSLIRRRNLDTIRPTITTDRQYLDDRGFTNVADAINTTPGVRGSITPNGAQGSFGQGVNFINFFNLGSNRTLTLVDGKRFVSSNPNTLFGQGTQGSQVDVNTIQSILVDHVDQVSIGGATVYGSDAIGGTANYILRERFNGFEANVLSGISEQGDAFRYNAAFLAGHDFMGGRLNVTVAYTRDRQDGLLANARDFYRANVGNSPQPTSAAAAAAGLTNTTDGRVNTGYGYNNSATDGNPGTLLYRDESIYYLNRNGVLTSATGNAGAVQRYAFDSTGSLVPFNRGIVIPGQIYASGGDGFRFNDYNQITSDLTRDTGNVFVHYDASDAFKPFFEGTIFHSYGNELVQQPTFNSNLFSGSSGPLTFLPNNPLLSGQAQQQLAALGITRFQVSRANDDLADVTGYSSTTIGRGVLGVDGAFKVGGRRFTYEVYGNYGRTRINDVTQDINVQHFNNAVNVTRNAAGQVVCTTAFTTGTGYAAPGPAPVADAACVPLNLFGSGQTSAAARAYVIQQNSIISVLQQKDFVANVQGSPFALFGNDYSIAVGYEHREEDGSFTPNAFVQQGLGRSVGIAPTKGSYNVDEVVGEVNLPIITADNGLGFIHKLEIDASGRYVDNTVNGGFFAWSAGGQFAPVRDITFRGNYTKSFRAPALTELFLPRSPQFATVTDLCSPSNINSGPVPATRARNCAAFLATFPNATPLDAQGATVPAVSGGNPNLQNEVSRSFTVGGIFTPRFLPGFSISVDYVDIRIAQPISNLTVAQIDSACFDNANFNTADPANGNAFCSQIQRYPVGYTASTAVNGGSRAGQVVNDPLNPGVTSGFVNGNRVFFSGIQGAIDYNVSLAGLGLPGRFSTDNIIFYVNRRLNDPTGIAPQRTDGIVGDPKFQWQSTERYVGDGGGLSVTSNFIGKQIATRTALSPDLREFNRFAPYVTVDASVWVDVDKRFRVTFAVFNIANHQYQDYLGFINTGLGVTDAIGRRFNVAA